MIFNHCPETIKPGFEGWGRLTAVKYISLLCTSCNRMTGDWRGVERGVGEGNIGCKHELELTVRVMPVVDGGGGREGVAMVRAD